VCSSPACIITVRTTPSLKAANLLAGAQDDGLCGEITGGHGVRVEPHLTRPVKLWVKQPDGFCILFRSIHKDRFSVWSGTPFERVREKSVLFRWRPQGRKTWEW